jgi:AcrR family transcriptional regulator
VIGVSDAVQPLPRGRHGLSREEVVASQRGRILWAMAEAVSERGYAATPVADVLRRARVSRETFYEHFANKEECFLAAYDAAATLVLEGLADVASDSGVARGGRALLDATLERYLATLAAQPAMARTFMIEVYAAGDAAIARRVKVQERFVEQVVAWAGAEGARQRFACESVVALVIGWVTHTICAGRASELPSLHAGLMAQIESLLAASGLSGR